MLQVAVQNQRLTCQLSSETLITWSDLNLFCSREKDKSDKAFNAPLGAGRAIIKGRPD